MEKTELEKVMKENLDKMVGTFMLRNNKFHTIIAHEIAELWADNKAQAWCIVFTLQDSEGKLSYCSERVEIKQ